MTGQVTVTVSKAFEDPAGLEAALRSEGITMIIKLNPVENFGSAVGYACAYTNLDFESLSVLDTVVSPAPVPPGDQEAWIINPDAMPAGSALFLQGGLLGHPGSVMFNALVLLASGDIGQCQPQTRPIPGYPGVFPYSAPASPSA